VRDDQQDLGSYRGFRMVLIADGTRVRGYAMRTLVQPDGSTTEDAFTIAGNHREVVVDLLRVMVDREVTTPRLQGAPPSKREGRARVPRCSWCGRVERGGGWMPQDLDATVPVAVSHSICPDCAERMLKKDGG
jgi:hypothetical protein